MSFLNYLKLSAAVGVLIAATPAVLAQQGDARAATTISEPGVATGERQAGELPDGSIHAAIRDAVERGYLDRQLASASDGVRAAAAQAYVTRTYDPLWTRYGAEDLVMGLESAPDYGLRIAPALMSSVRAAIRTLEGNPSLRDAAEAELTLSAAFMVYADARINGAIDPETLDGVKFARGDPEPLAGFLDAAGGGQLDHGRLDPDHQEYRDLVALLEVYRGHRDIGGFTRLEDGALVQLNEAADSIAALRQRLAEEGYDVEEARSRQDDDAGLRVFTPVVQAALEAFQADHGLAMDGVLGAHTIAALNTPLDDTIARIEANMERWRWAPGAMPDRHVRVNPAAYIAQGYENGRPAITMDAIVGQGRRPTPMMVDEIAYMVANPRWYVPESILARDKLETIREDPDYIPNNDYFVLDRATGARTPHAEIDWDQDGVEEAYRLVQGAGEENALGQIKFIFPNDQAIYLHGTPADYLFEERERAFSSGCVRLERPMDMARWIAEGEGSGLTYAQVADAVDSGETTRLNLDRTMPVYLFYFTVEEGQTGQGVFWEDIYGRDGRLIAAMTANPVALSAREGA